MQPKKQKDKLEAQPSCTNCFC